MSANGQETNKQMSQAPHPLIRVPCVDIGNTKRLRILTFNTGSSSIKAALYEMSAGAEAMLLDMDVARIGLALAQRPARFGGAQGARDQRG